MSPGAARVAAAALLALGAPLQAAEWSLDSTLQARLRQDQEPAAQEGAAPRVTRDLRVGGSLAAARSLEAQRTRLDLSLDLPAWSPDAARTVQGRAALSQGFDTERDGFNGAAELNADDTLDGQRSAADVLAGRSRRLRHQFSAAWEHRATERLDTRLSWRRTAVRLEDASLGASYRDMQLAGTLGWRSDERTQLSLAAAHSRFAQDDGDSRSRSDSLNLSATRAVTETASASVGIGLWHSRRDATLRGLACPLPEAFCSTGLVTRVPVSQAFSRASRGSQYSLRWSDQADERTGWSAAAARELAPGVLGVQQTDSLSLTASRQWTPELSASLAAARTRTAQPGGDERRASLDSLETALSWRLQEHLTLNASAVLRRLQGPAAGQGGSARQFSISLQYQGPRLFASR